MSKTKKSRSFKATKAFKNTMSNKGLLSDDQYKAISQGQTDELKGVPNKQMVYLLANNLIKEV